MKRILRVVGLVIFLSSVFLSGRASLAIAITQTQTNIKCYGAATGSIQINPTDGTGPYTYNWASGDTTQNRSGLIAGTYSVTITDHNGTTAGYTFNITQPSPLFITRSVSNESCGGQSIGAVSINITNPYSTYTYQWSNGATTQNISGLTAAVYYVTITDSIGCVTFDSANVVQPPGIGITDTITYVSCSTGLNNGAINVGVQYGNPAYTYLWNDGTTTKNRSNLATGTYTLTVTDAIGCTATLTANVTQLPGSMSINTAYIMPTCNGGSNGSLAITSVIGSTGPYTYLWSNGVTSLANTGLTAGTYSVTATSGTGCSASVSVILAQPWYITVTTHPFAPTCYGGSNGAITASSTSGVSPYTYAWSGGYVGSSVNSLTAGNYTVTATDRNGCTASATAVVPQPSQVIVTATSTPLACNGGSTGSVTTSVSGGAGPYSYWWGAGVVSANRTNVSSGTYNVTVTDAHGCTATTSATIAAYTPVSLSVTTVNNLCFGDTFGEVNETVHNGVAPYTYIWNTGDTTSSIGSLHGGNYTVTVTDHVGCAISQTSNIAAPPFPIVVNSTINDVSCFGLSNGSVALNPANGHPPYFYKWAAGMGTASSVANVATGSYTVSITDSWGCTVTATFGVTQPALITPVTTVTNVSCYGGHNGAINLSVTGGYAPFSYQWTDGIDSQTRVSLYPGNYGVTITDNHACTMTAGATVTQPTQLTSNATGVAPVCFGATTGSVTVAASGGTSPYSYNWGGGVATQNQTGIPSGTYAVTVTDANGCSSQSGVTLTSPAAISIVASGSNVACNGGNNGTIIITTTGGTSPFSYDWGGGITTQNRNNLGAGSYTVTVTDNAGCTATNTTVVGQSTNLAVTATATDATCFGSSTGSIATNTTGGTSPYTYNWGGGITLSQRNSLVAGSYAVTVTDHVGCSVSASSVVGQPAMLTVSSTTSPATCFGGNGGSINITAGGGTGAYTYNWGGGVTTQNRVNLTAGNYTLTVTDAAGCTVSNTATVAQPTQLILTSTQTNISCNGGSDGTIQLTATGGVGSYSFNWGGGIVSTSRAALAQGNYTATVTDANGCSAVKVTTLTQPNILTITPAITNVACFGQTTGAIALAVAGGTGPYTYNWGGVATQNRTGLSAGTYNVTVTDAHACSLSTSMVITQSQQITTSISSIINANCYGASNGGINIHINGGTPAYSYLWSNGSTSQNLTGVSAGTYHVSISDAFSCTTSTSINVTQPSQITFTPVVTNVLCNGAATGAIATIINGGNGGFSYLWSNGATTANISNVVAGAYTISYHDIQNCSASATVQITQPAAIALTSTQTNISCNGGNSGTATVTATGGTGALTYNWSNGQTTTQINQLAQGAYSITVRDANACSTSLTVNISQVNSIVLGLTATNVSCAGQHNGSIQTSVSGGVAPYNYNWTNGATTSNLTGLSASNYTVTVVDANNCHSTASAVITQPLAISVTQNVTNISCFGSSTGSIQISPAGGTGAYQYLWSNGSTVQNITGLQAGNYSVTVKDANGCSVVAGRSVSQPTQLDVSLNSNDVSCHARGDGNITGITTGGTGAYTYTWSNAATTSSLSNLQIGNYSVIVNDAAGCSASASAAIAQPTALSVQTLPTNVSCNGVNDGAVNTQVSGGTGMYSFKWSNHATAQQISQLSAGAYAVTVQDANACVVTGSATITQPAAIIVNTAHTDYACASSTGSINLTVSGGTSPYIYNWQDGASTQNRTALAAGNYQVTITDQHHCTQTGAATIAQLPQMSATVTSTNVSCNGGNNGNMNITVTGGTQPYAYSWSNSANTNAIQQLTANAYTVVVTDSRGCNVSTGASVTQPAAIQLSATVTSPSCNGSTDAAVTVAASGGTGNLSFAWSNSSSAQNLSNIAAGSYQLTVTDANSCTKVLPVAVTQPAVLSLTDAVTPVGCSGQNDGSAVITPAGGTPPYSYNWSNSEKLAQIDSLAPGNYSVTVIDNNGCNSTRSMMVTTSPPMVVTPTVQNAACKGVNNGSINLTITGGTLPYHYNWNNGQSAEAAVEFGAGSYAVTVSDARGCSAVSGGDIAISYALTVHATASASVTTGAAVQLAATANTDHGNTYNWTPASFVTCNSCANTSASPMQTTTFTVYTVDVNGCKAEDTVTIQVNSVSDIFIPNAFTPNADGVNDQFKIFGDLSNVYFMDMAIFDRWGEKVFESNDPNFEWDGTYRGQPAPNGVYIYVATAAFSNGTHRDFKGSVTLLR